MLLWVDAIRMLPRKHQEHEHDEQDPGQHAVRDRMQRRADQHLAIIERLNLHPRREHPIIQFLTVCFTRLSTSDGFSLSASARFPRPIRRGRLC